MLDLFLFYCYSFAGIFDWALDEDDVPVLAVLGEDKRLVADC
jgi:hypothetical protein